MVLGHTSAGGLLDPICYCLGLESEAAPWVASFFCAKFLHRLCRLCVDETVHRADRKPANLSEGLSAWIRFLPAK